MGSETSQYHEEKRTTVIPLVAASETGGAQTQPLYSGAYPPTGGSYCNRMDGGYKATAFVDFKKNVDFSATTDKTVFPSELALSDSS